MRGSLSRRNQYALNNSIFGLRCGSIGMCNVALDLKIGLGSKLRLRGRGIETGLRGNLRLTAPTSTSALASR